METHSKINNIILEGIVGSQAYNLQTEKSDIDKKGIFVNPTRSMFSLKKPKDLYDHVNPDYAYYEIEKFINLALKCNPTILELLWLDDYTILTDIGRLLIENREIFLSQLVRKTYYGYAKSQLEKNYRNASHIGEYRLGKHARHIFRLLMQGQELLETGKLRIRCTDEERKYIFSFMNMDKNELFDVFERKKFEFDEVWSVLPEEPDYEKADKLLIQIREQFL